MMIEQEHKNLYALVKRIAWTFARRIPSHVSLDDLVGAGGLGLAEAYQKRDTMPVEQFELFAASRIRGAILDELRRLDPLSRDTRRVAKELAAAVTKSGSVSEGEVADNLGISPRTLALIHESRGVASLTPLSMLPAANDTSPEDLYAAKEDVERVKQMTKCLTPRMREVMDAKYGDDQSQSEIAHKLGVTEARICQLHSGAIRRVVELFALADEVA